MDTLDIFYRAFKAFKENTATDVLLSRSKKVVQSKNEKDKQNVIVYVSTCTIEEDWVLRIEAGIDYIAKAIKEERQFIRNDGEILPIEKVRKTSKASIEDLAKHSNYITHEPMEDAASDVVPDKLLVVQKEHDFTIYENRVVYALLVYLRDFINSRLTVIKEITNTYEAHAFMHQNIELGNSKLHVDFKIDDVRKNDPILVGKNSCKEIIDRLDELLTKVLILLKTPLMIEVSKVDMISLPLIKTNVLKMNHNFRECASLFEYLIAYDKPGYTVTKEEKELGPLALDIVNDYVEDVLLYSFITYMYGNDLEEDLKKRYFEDEEARKRKQEDELIERANRIKIKAKLDDITLDDLLLTLDEAKRVLEKRAESLEENLKQMEADHKKEIVEVRKGYEERIDNLKLEHEDHINELNLEHEKNKEELKADHQNKMNELANSYEDKINELKEQFMKEKEEAIVDMRNRMNEALQEKEEALKVKEETEKENSELRARNIALENSISRKDPSEYTSKERFDQLEKDKKSFENFYKRAWEETKKAIRKENLKIDKSKKKKDKAKEEPVVEEEKDGGEE